MKKVGKEGIKVHLRKGGRVGGESGFSNKGDFHDPQMEKIPEEQLYWRGEFEREGNRKKRELENRSKRRGKLERGRIVLSKKPGEIMIGMIKKGGKPVN